MMRTVWGQVHASKVSVLSVRRVVIVPMATSVGMDNAVLSVRQLVTVHFFINVNPAAAWRRGVHLIENVRRFSTTEVHYAVRVNVGFHVSAMLSA